MPLFPAKKEVFAWIKDGRKTIDVRKGGARRGPVAVFQNGPYCLRLQIIRKETGRLKKIVTPDNFKSIVPSAGTLDDTLAYLRGLYGDEGKLFTAYYLAQPEK